MQEPLVTTVMVKLGKVDVFFEVPAAREISLRMQS